MTRERTLAEYRAAMALDPSASFYTEEEPVSYFPEPCNLPGHVHGCPGRAGGDHELAPSELDAMEREGIAARIVDEHALHHPDGTGCGCLDALDDAVDEVIARSLAPRRFEVGDRVRVRPEARSAFEGEAGTVVSIFTYGDGSPSSINVRVDACGIPLGFSASQLDLVGWQS